MRRSCSPHPFLGLLVSRDVRRLDDHHALRVHHIAFVVQRVVGHGVAVLIHQNLLTGLGSLHVTADILSGLGLLVSLVAAGHQTHGHHQSQQQGNKILHLFHSSCPFIHFKICSGNVIK